MSSSGPTTVNSTPKRAIFLDRDGVLNEDKAYVFRASDLVILPKVGEALATLQARGFALVIVSNQSGVARGLFSLEEAQAFNRALVDRLAIDHSIHFTDTMLCPYHPQGIVAEFSRESELRKPAPGMVLQAAKRHGLDLSTSYLIGDKASDIECAVRAGVRGIQVWRNQIVSNTTNEETKTHEKALVRVQGLYDTLTYLV